MSVVKSLYCFWHLVSLHYKKFFVCYDFCLVHNRGLARGPTNKQKTSALLASCFTYFWCCPLVTRCSHLQSFDSQLHLCWVTKKNQKLHWDYINALTLIYLTFFIKLNPLMWDSLLKTSIAWIIVLLHVTLHHHSIHITSLRNKNLTFSWKTKLQLTGEELWKTELLYKVKYMFIYQNWYIKLRAYRHLLCS